MNRLVNKALKSNCRHKVAAVAFNKKGEVPGYKTNVSRFMCKGGGVHAEMALIHEYGLAIKTILICRVNHRGRLLPLDPCPNCSKVAKKLGISIYSLR